MLPGLPGEQASRRSQRPTLLPGEAVVSSSCWSCRSTRYKRVPYRLREHAHFSWSCESCEVDWVGPGEPADHDLPETA